MNETKSVYILHIEFPMAFFKIPYTVKTRKTYLIPRKKALFSIFNAFFEKPISFWKITGSRKNENEKELIKNYLVGAELLEFKKITEKQQLKQIKETMIRTISETELLINAKYKFYLVGDVNMNSNPVNYYPFAGQNDYLAIKWKLEKTNGTIKDITSEEELEIKNYQLVPKEKITLLNNKNSEIIIENALENLIVCKGWFKIKDIKILELEDGNKIILH